MKSERVVVIAVLTAGLGLTGCQSARMALGMQKVVPDEFRVVTKAPLVVPPDYSLRPPSPGEPRPQELQPESQARQALLGQSQPVDRSEGESLLVTKAGGGQADPLVRYVVDDEFGDVTHKDRSFADKVMFWRKDKPETQGGSESLADAGGAPAPVDPNIEAQRIAKLTADRPVTIKRASDDHMLKLPGL